MFYAGGCTGTYMYTGQVLEDPSPPAWAWMGTGLGVSGRWGGSLTKQFTTDDTTALLVIEPIAAAVSSPSRGPSSSFATNSANSFFLNLEHRGEGVRMTAG